MMKRFTLPLRARRAAVACFSSPCGLLSRRGTAALAVAARGVHDHPTASTTASTTSGVGERAIGGGFDVASFAARAARGEEDVSCVGKSVVLRGRAERCRGRGKLGFIHLRQPPAASVQVVCAGKDLAKQVKQITPESIIEVEGVLQRAEQPVVSTTCAQYEVHATAVRLVSAAETPLPFPLHDTNTKLDTRLNHRPMDLRTPLSSALLRLVSLIGLSFRARLSELGFVEIHTPKLVPAASEGGSAVFKVAYFDRPAYLAQSPQLYKQMVLMGDAMRVFEVGPVFRAENSLTHRHLTEYVGLDAELVIEKDHTEVLDVLEYVVCSMIHDAQDGAGRALTQIAKAALAQPPQQQTTENTPVSDATNTATPLRDVVFTVPQTIMDQYGIGNDAAQTCASKDPYQARVGGRGPVRPPSSYPGMSAEDAQSQSVTVQGPRVLRLGFANVVQMLLDAGEIDEAVEDLSLQQERRVGQLIAQRYGVDVYVIDQFPSSARPFYTMPVDPVKAPFGPTRSFDMYLRGEEICSGAQRLHDPAQLETRMTTLGVDPGSVTDYVNAFRYGAWPHGGFGLGLERIALFLVGANDIRQVSTFPRDPRRVAP